MIWFTIQRNTSKTTGSQRVSDEGFECFLLSLRRTDTVINNPSYKSTMRLTIYNVQKYDYGTYKCVAKNPRGETDGTIRLYCKFNVGNGDTHTFSLSQVTPIKLCKTILVLKSLFTRYLLVWVGGVGMSTLIASRQKQTTNFLINNVDTMTRLMPSNCQTHSINTFCVSPFANGAFRRVTRTRPNE